MNKPVVTVITVSFNARKHIQQTIKSVISQSYSDIEYIVIDGGSHDGTVEIIEQYKSSIHFFVSEPDKGISDAMNKGLSHAHGEYIIFLHADDYFADSNVLTAVFSQRATNNEIILCDILFGKQFKRLSPRGLNGWINVKNGVLHQGAICKRRLFEQIGDFDNRFKIAMDYDFFLRAYRSGVKAEKLSIILSVMRDCGISSKKHWPDLLTRFAEEKKVHQKNANTNIISLCYAIFWLIYIPYRHLGSYIKKSK